jgi:hypothetical protein
MTKGSKLTRPWGGPGTQSQHVENGILTHFSWNQNPDNKEWEIVRVMPEGTDDVVEFSSSSRAEAANALRKLVDRDYPGLAQQGR